MLLKGLVTLFTYFFDVIDSLSQHTSCKFSLYLVSDGGAQPHFFLRSYGWSLAQHKGMVPGLSMDAFQSKAYTTSFTFYFLYLSCYHRLSARLVLYYNKTALFKCLTSEDFTYALQCSLQAYIDVT